MIRNLAIIPAVLALTHPAWGQDIRVRSGEHGDFTRVVLDLPSSLGWTVEQNSQEAVDVRLAGDGLVFDLSRGLDRLSAGRVESLSRMPDGQGVRIDLGCECAANAYVVGDRMLVVDIRPGAPSRDRQSSSLNTAPVREQQDMAEAIPSLLSTVRVGSNPGIGPERPENALLPGFNAQARPVEPQAAPESATGLDPGVFERLLAEQLATAATDGLLDSAMREIPDPGQSETNERNAEQQNAGSSQGPDQTAARALEAAILGREPGDMNARIRIGGATCIPDRDLDIASWGGENALSDKIPNLRGRLFGEFDRLDHEVMLDLARAYTSIGFGAEARTLLEMDPKTQEPALYTVAGIVDGDHDRSGVLAGQTNCEGSAAFWALVGSTDLPGNAEVNVNAVLTTFEGLPTHLRTLLGPQLATRFAEEGLPDPARNVLSRLQRATGGVSEDMLFSEAQIDRLGGSHEDAHQILNAIAVKPGANAPEAMAQAIELATENREKVNPELADLSGAYSTQMRDTEEGPKLWLAHLRALTANRQYDESFAQLFDHPDYPEETRAKATSDLLTLLSEQAQDTAFLKHALANPDGYDGLASDRSAILVAQRLLTLGLPQPAMRWLDFAGIDRREEAVKVLRARAHLAQAEPEQAEILLVGLEGDEVTAIRAEARRMMGDYRYAAEAYRSLGNAADARNAAWLAGDPNLSGSEEDAMGAAIQLRQETIPDPAVNAPSLAIAETVAGAGAETRDTIRALLDATRLSAD